jgi:hypothetical protein
VKSRKQAMAIGLSEIGKKGAKVLKKKIRQAHFPQEQAALARKSRFRLNCGTTRTHVPSTTPAS